MIIKNKYPILYGIEKAVVMDKPEQILKLERAYMLKLEEQKKELEILKDYEYRNRYSNNTYQLNNKGEIIKLELHDKITDVTHLKDLHEIIELNLEANYIRDISSLSELKKLVKLNLAKNLIDNISGLKTLTNLKELYLENNAITDISSLKELKQLNILNIGNNRINDISSIEGLILLIELYLNNNKNFSESQLSNIDSIKNLKRLTILNLNDNNIVDINPLSQLTKLSHLLLNNNKINDISDLRNLGQIIKLELSNNKITKIDSLQKLDKLIQLTLDNNKINDIEILNKNKKIKSLDLRNNCIENLYYFEDLKELYDFKIRGNPCKNYPEELHCDNNNKRDDFNCFPHYKAWFEDIKKGKEKNKHVKVFFTGNGNVGKSSIIEALKYEKCNKVLDSTHGVIIENFPSKDNEVIFNIWDFGGQEIFYGTHQLFIKGDAINCIVFDKKTEEQDTCKDRKTSEDVRNFPIQFWYDNAWQNNKINPTIIIQNKIDETDEIESLNLNTVSLLENNNTPLINVSAIQGINIDFLETQLVNESKKLVEYNMDMPKSWLNVRRHILSIQQQENNNYKKVITTEEFRNICIEYNVLNTSIDTILYFLHNNGVIYYNEYFLPGKIIIDQRWAIDAIYKIFERGSSFYTLLREFNKGYSTLNRLYTAWGDKYTNKEQELFVSFMKSCGLCFPVRNYTYFNNNYDKDCIYVFPEFLRKEIPENIRILKEQLNPLQIVILEKKHLYLSTQIIQSLISQLSVHAILDNIWRNGICFISNSQIILIEANYEEKTILLSFNNHVLEKRFLSILFSKINIDNEIEKWQIKYLNQETFKKLNQTTLHDITKTDKSKENIFLEEEKYFDDDDDNLEVFEDTEIEEAFNITSSTALSKENYTVLHTSPLKAFISYSKHDGELSLDGIDYLKEFKTTIQPLMNQKKSLIVWDDTKLYAGENWDDKIKEELVKSDVIFFLLSRYLLATNYVNETEMKIATDRLEKNECLIIPIQLKTCPFEEYPIFSKPNIIPRKGISITSFKNNPNLSTIDDAWYAVYNEIKKAIEQFKENKNI